MSRFITILLFLSLPFLDLAGQAKYSLVLTADGNERDTIQRGEVLLLEIVLTNPMANSASLWNAAAENQLKELEEKLKHEKISKEDFEKEKKSIESQLKKTTAITIGSEKQPWFQMIKWNIVKTGDRTATSWPIKYLSNPGTDDIAVLDQSAYYSASFGIDPVGLTQLTPGSYVLTAIIGEISSTAVTIRVDAGSLPVQQQNSSKHLLKQGNFYCQAGDAIKGIEQADKVLTREPASIGALLLKADALRFQNAWSASLEMYRGALEAYGKKAGRDAEPPEYIIDMIEIVKSKMN